MVFYKEFMRIYEIPPDPPLQRGELKADGAPRAIQKNPEVIAAYLGTDWQG
jgi:ABC-type uncharacterized transport system ATPase subunit